MKRLLVIIGLTLSGCATPSPALQPATGITANLRSASFITNDLDKSVAFYETYLNYKVLGRSLTKAQKSRQVVGARGDETVRYVSMVPAQWSQDTPHFTGISFIEIKSAQNTPFDQNATRASRAGELVLAHRVTGINKIASRIERDGIPIVAPLGLSGSGKSMSMAILDPNGIRVEMYEY